MGRWEEPLGESSVNEEQVIALFKKAFGSPGRGFLPIGDDVALLPLGKGKVVVKCDMSVASTDAPPQMTLQQLARKAVAMAVSDFAAKGVKPIASLLSLALPHGFRLKDAEKLVEGFRLVSKEFGVKVIGGDTNEGKDLVVDCTLVGFAQRIVPRRGAHEGDIVAVSGVFGYTAAGLRMLLKGRKEKQGPSGRAIREVLYPTPRLRLGLALASHRVVRASIDSSDGLALSLYHLAEASGLGIRLHKLPLDDGVRRLARALKVSAEELALYGGEELHLVVAVDPSRLTEGVRLAAELKEQLIPIGRFTRDIDGVIGPDGRRIARRGWTHLRG